MASSLRMSCVVYAIRNQRITIRWVDCEKKWSIGSLRKKRVRPVETFAAIFDWNSFERTEV